MDSWKKSCETSTKHPRSARGNFIPTLKITPGVYGECLLCRLNPLLVSSFERASIVSNWCVRITECCRKDIKGHQRSGVSRGMVQGVRTPPDFLMKRVLYFATKLHSRNIQKCDCLGVPSVICVFPAPTAGFHTLRNT